MAAHLNFHKWKECAFSVEQFRSPRWLLGSKPKGCPEELTKILTVSQTPVYAYQSANPVLYDSWQEVASEREGQNEARRGRFQQAGGFRLCLRSCLGKRKAAEGLDFGERVGHLQMLHEPVSYSH